MAKFCSNCGKELDENTAICLNCGVLVDSKNNKNQSNEKKKGMPTWAIVLIVVGVLTLLPIIIVVILAITAYNVITDSEFEVEEYTEETIMQKGTIGDTLISEDFKITLTDMKTYSSLEEDRTIIPEEGKEFLVFFLDIENISNEKEYISIHDFDGYVDGYTISTKNIYSNIEGVDELSISLLPGKKTKGYIAFEVENSWKEFELHHESWLDDTEIIFTAENKNSSDITGA